MKEGQIYMLQVLLHKEPNWKQKESLTETHNILFTLQEFYPTLPPLLAMLYQDIFSVLRESGT